MGSGASKRSAPAAPPADPADPLSDVAIARKFSEMLGVPEPALREALPGLNRCFARRLPGRRLYKPLDLWALGAFVQAPNALSVLGVDFE